MNCVSVEPDFWREGDTDEGCKCPLLLVPEFEYEFKAHNMLAHNLTPNGSGVGWEHESYAWNQAIEIIDGVMAKMQQEKIEAAKAEQR